MARLVRMYSSVLSITIAHTQTEATSRPIITALTTICADQNSPQIDRSAEVSGSTDCATSVGFMNASFRLQVADRIGPASAGETAWRGIAMARRTHSKSREI